MEEQQQTQTEPIKESTNEVERKLTAGQYQLKEKKGKSESQRFLIVRHQMETSWILSVAKNAKRCLSTTATKQVLRD